MVVEILSMQLKFIYNCSLENMETKLVVFTDKVLRGYVEFKMSTNLGIKFYNHNINPVINFRRNYTKGFEEKWQKDQFWRFMMVQLS